MIQNTYTTREQWLTAAVHRLTPDLEAQGQTVPENLHAIVSWPHGQSKAIGQCFGSVWAKNGSTYITVSPVLGDDPARVLDVLLHEMIHATGIMNHGAPFKKVALAVGLTGKMKSTVAGPELRERLEVLAAELGPYPHETMQTPPKADKEKADKPKNRIRLASPSNEDYIVEISRKRLETYGVPLCPFDNVPMLVLDE